MRCRDVFVLSVAFALYACGDNMPPPDDGFDVPCEVSFDGRLYTTCESLLGQDGLCVQNVTGNPDGVCYSWCADDGTCPEDQQPIPVIGDKCYCQP